MLMMTDDPRIRRLELKVEATEYIEAGLPEAWEVEASNPICLAIQMSAMAAMHLVPRGPLAWEGPGKYRLTLEMGASQSTDWDKLDDCRVTAVKYGALDW